MTTAYQETDIKLNTKQTKTKTKRNERKKNK